jgi:chromosome segregation ATPase
LTISRKLVSSMQYAANNKTSKDKVLVIEHPIRYDWKLVDTQKPFETTQGLYRFKGTALANKVTVLTVNEESVQDEEIALASANLEELVLYSRSGPGSSEIPSNVRDAIGKAVQLRQSVVDVDRDIATRTQRVAEITSEQNRIRENMKTVAPSTQYYSRLLEKLNEQESAIESLQKERDALTAKRDALRRELDDYLGGLMVG